ncbi:MAG: phosphomannomutase/phosphoglucomutase [Oscillospiraceae bacterium]|nr:phosphomannomutase/phosphoglucomutase [Oscillospiraceae bacterium]
MDNDGFDLRLLKSGTDLRGVASGDSGEIQLTPERARRAAVGFALWLSVAKEKQGEAVETIRLTGGQPCPLCVAVGRDSRLMGSELAGAVREGLCSAGARVLDVGMSTTPALFMITQHPQFHCDAAVMVTASHMPARYNGLKFITQTGGLESSELDALLKQTESLITRDEQTDGLASRTLITDRKSAGSIEQVDFTPYYLDGLTAQTVKSLGANSPLKGLCVVIDASGGGGGFYARWLESLGADISGSANLAPDGMFPAHAPNPEDAAAIKALSDAVVSARADLGVILDADCDRAALVAGDGSPLYRERLIALCADMVIREAPGAAVVTDSVTSPALRAFIERRGGIHRRHKRGYKNVINEAKRLNEAGTPCPLAIETSGHAAFADNRFLDDGMMLATRLIIEAVRMKREGRTLTDRIADLAEPLESSEWRIPMEDSRRRAAALDLMRTWALDNLGEGYSLAESAEGVRVERADGWFLLRASLHEPLLVWNAASDIPGGIERMKAALVDALSL